MDELCKQLEFYFGDANLNHSHFMTKHMKSGKGYITISVIQTFNRVSGRSVQDIQEAVKISSTLELSPDMLKVKRKTPFKPLPRGEIDRRTIYVDQLPRNVEHEPLKEAFAKYGQVDYVSLPRKKILKGTEEVMITKGFAFVEFSSASEATAALEMDGKVLNGSELTVISKAEWLTTYIPQTAPNSYQNHGHGHGHGYQKEDSKKNSYQKDHRSHHQYEQNQYQHHQHQHQPQHQHQHQNVRMKQTQPPHFTSAAIVKIEGVDCSKADLIEQIKLQINENEDFRLDLIKEETTGHIRFSSKEAAERVVNTLKEKYRFDFLSEEEHNKYFEYLKSKRKPKQVGPTEGNQENQEFNPGDNVVAPEDKLNIEKGTYNKKYPKQKTNNLKDAKPNHIIFSELEGDETEGPVTSNILDDLDDLQEKATETTQQTQQNQPKQPQTQDQPQPQTQEPQTQTQAPPQTQPQTQNQTPHKKRKREDHKRKKPKKQKKT
eukprot:TRINITY_DN2924_c0_g1_i2.p1 TRINITY_DN2924_c0_g1~~TRINITY_DN2924_c0_g1_i2.p1  ORF type:complete len:505 (-),score=157.84 TRINITY_DN2924_c0_g1_i2:80-1546(-)